MKKPVIAISTTWGTMKNDKSENRRVQAPRLYADVLAEAGAAPILLPPQTDPDTVAHLIDGWLIPGGDDFDAGLWGEENHPAVKPEAPERFEFEKKLFGTISPQMPVLGICYGAQFLNIVRGGSLIQHVPDLVNHKNHQGGNMIQVTLEPDSRLSKAIGVTELEGTSYHHQAVGRLGESFRVVGQCPDGITEAIETTEDRWMIGVQWHPEKKPDDPNTKTLMRRFVEAASKYALQNGLG
jgi:putative glutamine amidotransferase